MSIAMIQQQLSTPEGFAKAVSPKSAVFGAGILCLLLGLGGIAMNLFQLGSASDWNWQLMFMFFFDAEAIEFTGSRAGRSEMWRYLYVYGPLVLIPLAIVLIAVHFSTRRNAGAKLYADFRERGWVGRQLLSGLQVKNGNSTVSLAFVSHPSIPDEAFEQTVRDYSGWLQSLDRKASKEIAKAAVKAGVLNGVSASALAPQLPPAITVAPVQGKGEFAVVVPPASGEKGKLQVLPVGA